MSDRGESGLVFANGCKNVPVEHEACRRWLERNRWPRDSGPHVPKFQGSLHVRILNRFTVSGEACPRFRPRYRRREVKPVADGPAIVQLLRGVVQVKAYLHSATTAAIVRSSVRT